jgi:hypothetical protein
MVDLAQPDANVRSAGYYIAGTDTRCWYCGGTTRLLALAVPQDHETLDAGSEEGAGQWQPAGAAAFIFRLTRLAIGVQRRLLPFAPRFRLAHNQAMSDGCWANHCEHCDRVLDDQELHCEPGVFMPGSAAQAARIELLRIDEALEAAAAGYAPEPEFFQFMRRP